MYLIVKEDDERVLLNTRLNRRGVYDLKPVVVGRESSDIRKDTIDILGLSILYLWIGIIGG
jgi:hypothetical protein